LSEHDSYYSLASTSEGNYKEKGSKFLAFAYPVVSEEEIREKLELLRKHYHDARHHCYAYLLKPQEGREETYRTQDDGEPTHSAGDPILGQIRSYQLQDVLIVVVRYFGGTKLGISGLIQAYRAAAADAIERNQIVQKTIQLPLTIRFPYSATSEVMQFIDQTQLHIVQQEYNEECIFQLAVPRSQWPLVTKNLSGIEGVVILEDPHYS